MFNSSPSATWSPSVSALVGSRPRPGSSSSGSLSASWSVALATVVSFVSGALAASGGGAEVGGTSLATGAVSVPGSTSVTPRPGRRSVQVTVRSLSGPETLQLPLVPSVPLASSMTTRPLCVWARTLPFSPTRPRLRPTTAMRSRFIDDLPVRGLADSARHEPWPHTRRRVACTLSINVWRAGRVSLPGNEERGNSRQEAITVAWRGRRQSRRRSRDAILDFPEMVDGVPGDAPHEVGRGPERTAARSLGRNLPTRPGRQCRPHRLARPPQLVIQRRLVVLAKRLRQAAEIRRI